MASESTSSQQSQQLIPSSKVNFRCTDSIIGFNNVVAIFAHSNELFRPMLSFLFNCCINKALTLQPTTMYVEYLKEFWYTAEVEEETKTIIFLLSWWDEPLSFTQYEFISAIGLPICKEAVPLPPKETVRAGFIIRTSLTGFPGQSVRSSNAYALDSLYLLVSLYRTPAMRLPPLNSIATNRTSPITELVDFVEAHDHLHSILVSEHHGSWGVKNLVVVHELEPCSFPARFGEVQLSLVTLDAELEVFYPLSDNHIPDP
ncbi:hypothetical protein Tco_0777150 [Tanacetum coccineum]